MDPRTGQDYILVSKDVYDRLRDRLFDDAGGEEELRAALARSAEANGWNEPGMDACDRYDEERAKRCR